MLPRPKRRCAGAGLPSGPISRFSTAEYHIVPGYVLLPADILILSVDSTLGEGVLTSNLPGDASSAVIAPTDTPPPASDAPQFVIIIGVVDRTRCRIEVENYPDRPASFTALTTMLQRLGANAKGETDRTRASSSSLKQECVGTTCSMPSMPPCGPSSRTLLLPSQSEYAVRRLRRAGAIPMMYRLRRPFFFLVVRDGAIPAGASTRS